MRFFFKKYSFFSFVCCRKLTDKPKDEKSPENNSAIASDTNDLKADSNSSGIISEIAKGNCALLPVFKFFDDAEPMEIDAGKSAKRARTDDNDKNGHLSETHTGIK